MRSLLVPLLLTLSLTGCVVYLHDSKLADLKAAPATLADFAGSYYDDASYHTPPNIIGLEGWETLGGALTGMNFRSAARIQVETNGDILVSASAGAFGPVSIKYVNGRDFEFKGSSVVFKARRSSGSSELAIGTIKMSMVWMLDASRRLIVVSRNDGGGLIAGVIPTVSGGATFSIFPRLSDGYPLH